MHSNSPLLLARYVDTCDATTIKYRNLQIWCVDIFRSMRIQATAHNQEH